MMLKIKQHGLNSFFFLSLLLGLANVAFAQEHCDDLPSKKVRKLLDEGTNRKYLLHEQIRFLTEAIELDEDCIICRFERAMLYFEHAEKRRVDYGQAEKEFRDVVTRCPYYHADPWYYLGLISYMNKDYSEAKKAFEFYVKFPPDDPEKLGKDADKKYDDVKEVMEEIDFYAEFYDNPVPFEPEVVRKVSGSGDEYLPMISPDNSLLFFTRKSMKKTRGDLFEKEIELFMWANRDTINFDYSEGSKMPPPFNLGDHYGGVTISVNNKELFVTVCKVRSDGYNDCDIYVSRWTRLYNEKYGSIEWGWGELEDLGEGVNTQGGWEAQPSVTPDGKTLYFATARETSIDYSIDIYVSTKQEDGTWGQAVPVAGGINTSANEKSPFIHADSKTLYFSSNGGFGAGGYDIFYTRQDSNNTWQEPKNIGFPINSSQDEHGLIVSMDGNFAYFSTNRLEGEGGYDIYRFALPGLARPEEVVLVKGNVSENGAVMDESTKVTIRNLKTRAIRDVKIDQEDGSFATVVNVSRNDYLVQIESEESAFEAYILSKSHSQPEGIVDLDIELSELAIGEDYVLNDIFYETNKANIDQTSKWLLDAFADYLKKNPTIKIMILGHTDNVGDDMDNYALSADRAFTVKEYLVEQGVNAKRIDFKGYGESQPRATNETAEGRALNRRTEFRLLDK
jgi:outer membrane protein OmpA-like peptidoglycan-associated protein/tetratricopeptide (TPR) repeat protein